MLYAKNKEGERILSTKDTEAWCPGCASLMVSKCGSIMVHHWAHPKNSECDQWGENEGEWHLGWKKRAEEYNPEIIVEKYIKKGDIWHFADLYSEGDGVTELQHSSISVEEIAKREQFYGKMKWLFDVREAYDENRLTIWEKTVKDGERFYVTFTWKHCKKSLLYVKKLLFLDLGNNQILHIQKKNIDGKMFGWGYILDYDYFLAAYL